MRPFLWLGIEIGIHPLGCGSGDLVCGRGDVPCGYDWFGLIDGSHWSVGH